MSFHFWNILVCSRWKWDGRPRAEHSPQMLLHARVTTEYF